MDSHADSDIPLHLRHQPPTPLQQPRELIVALPQMQSQVNVARVVRAAGCFGVQQLLIAGQGKIDPKIARDALDYCQISRHRSLPPVIESWRANGYRIVGLEQATGSVSIYDYKFAHKSLLVVGHERNGMDDSLLRLLDEVVEIPVYGRPLSYNAATSAILGMYEYCRQFPSD
jgi:tRNA G18 (ribose-2'-O)-methylase SpoU